MRFIAVLDDWNDSRRLAMTKCRKKGREKERKEGREERRKEKRETNGEGREREGRRKSALGERGARSTCTLYERNPRRRRWAVVHLMHAYARISRIPYTPPTDLLDFL